MIISNPEFIASFCTPVLHLVVPSHAGEIVETTRRFLQKCIRTVNCDITTSPVQINDEVISYLDLHRELNVLQDLGLSNVSTYHLSLEVQRRFEDPGFEKLIIIVEHKADYGVVVVCQVK